MAAVHSSTASILSSFLPRLAAPAASSFTRSAVMFSRQLSIPSISSLSFAIPAAISLNIPASLAGLWESVLRAVPKKKTSHMKKRHRFMHNNGQKDTTALNKCSACGHLKRAHLLCPYCVKEVQKAFKAQMQKAADLFKP